MVFIVVLSYIYFYIKGNLYFWDYLSYCFILAAYLMFIATPYFVKQTKNKTIQEMLVYAVSFIYLGIQIIYAFFVSCYLTFRGTFNLDTYCLFQAIITGIYLIILFLILHVNVEIYLKFKKQYVDTIYIKEIKSELMLLVNQTTDNAVKNNIKNIIDLIISCPSKSYKELVNIENSIINEINELKNLIYDNAESEKINICCVKIENMINKRNAEIKLIQYNK